MTTEAETGVLQAKAKERLSHRKLRETHATDSPSEPTEETNPVDNLILDFWPPER